MLESGAECKDGLLPYLLLKLEPSQQVVRVLLWHSEYDKVIECDDEEGNHEHAPEAWDDCNKAPESRFRVKISVTHCADCNDDTPEPVTIILETDITKLWQRLFKNLELISEGHNGSEEADKYRLIWVLSYHWPDGKHGMCLTPIHLANSLGAWIHILVNVNYDSSYKIDASHAQTQEDIVCRVLYFAIVHCIMFSESQPVHIRIDRNQTNKYLCYTWGLLS